MNNEIWVPACLVAVDSLKTSFQHQKFFCLHKTLSLFFSYI